MKLINAAFGCILTFALSTLTTAQADTSKAFQLFMKEIAETCINAPENVPAVLTTHGFQPDGAKGRAKHPVHTWTIDQRVISMRPPEQSQRNGLWGPCQIIATPAFSREEAAALIDPILPVIPIPPGSFEPRRTFGGQWCLGATQELSYTLATPETHGEFHIARKSSSSC